MPLGFRAAQFSILAKLKRLGPMTNSGSYAWRSRPESERVTVNRELLIEVKRIHQDSRYGSPRVHAVLQAQGRGVSRGRVERLMFRHGIRAIMAQPRRVRTTDSRHDLPIARNLLDRNFSAPAPDRVWLADTTYIPTDEGWLYLAAVLDLYRRKVVGWAMRDHLRTELPHAALAMAIQRQRPDTGLIHHSDRGVQYASIDYRKVLQSVRRHHGIHEPQGGRFDNAPMESFFHTLKTELVPSPAIRNRGRRPTRHIRLHFYNRTRLHSAIGYISTIEMERKAA